MMSLNVTSKRLREIGEVSETGRLKERWLGGEKVSKESGDACSRRHEIGWDEENWQ